MKVALKIRGFVLVAASYAGPEFGISRLRKPAVRKTAERDAVCP